MSKVFVSVTMSLDGFIAPEWRSDEQWVGQWSQLQQYAFHQKFVRENLKLGEGGETGVDNRILEETFARTNIPEAPWYIVEGNDKKRARLNCIDHLLTQIPYEPVPQTDIALPERVFNPDYERKTLPPELYVPEKY